MNDKLQNDAKEQEGMDRTCKKCGKKLFYSYVKGQFFCNSCDFKEKDTYGKIKTILDNDSDLSRPELAAILGLTIGELNEYFDENSSLINPRASYRSIQNELRNSKKRICPQWGTLLYLDSEKNTICPTCGRQTESDLNKVKNFLSDIGLAPTYIVSMATGVSEQEIEDYFEEEGIELPEDGSGFFRCKLCGAPIRNGKSCPTCATRQLKKLGKIYSDERKKVDTSIPPKWHFIRNKNK